MEPVYHQPVLAQEIITFFQPGPNNIYIDATLGNGGHTLELLKHGAKVYGIDQDPQNLTIATSRIRANNVSKNFIGINDNFANLEKIISSNNIKCISGILFDLGLSSNQLKSATRGFSFNDSTSLDMRLDPTVQTLTAKEIINTYSAAELFNIFSKYAQEKYSREIADNITTVRKSHPFETSTQLADYIKEFYRQKHQSVHLHPATKILMALRIATNNEYQNVTTALNSCLKLHQTKIALITFHSGEDRLVKQFINQNKQSFSQFSTRPIKPSSSEIRQNHLSRSSLLRTFTLK